MTAEPTAGAPLTHAERGVLRPCLAPRPYPRRNRSLGTSPPERSYAEIGSPLGRVLLLGAGDALTGLYLIDHGHGPAFRADWTAGSDVLDEAATQLGEYFAGRRTRFELPIRPEGTPFQRRVWDALAEVPWGTTIGYGELAAVIGRPTAARAVGAANGANPISIVIPCHRVVGAGGALTGYGWGVERKAWLLAHERGRLPCS